MKKFSNLLLVSILVLSSFSCSQSYADDILVEWQAPTELESGEGVGSNLGGYKLVYQIGDQPEKTVIIEEGSATSYLIENVGSSLLSLKMSAFDHLGTFGEFSPTVTHQTTPYEYIPQPSLTKKSVVNEIYKDCKEKELDCTVILNVSVE